MHIDTAHVLLAEASNCRLRSWVDPGRGSSGSSGDDSTGHCPLHCPLPPLSSSQIFPSTHQPTQNRQRFLQFQSRAMARPRCPDNNPFDLHLPSRAARAAASYSNITHRHSTFSAGASASDRNSSEPGQGHKARWKVQLQGQDAMVRTVGSAESQEQGAS